MNKYFVSFIDGVLKIGLLALLYKHYVWKVLRKTLLRTEDFGEYHLNIGQKSKNSGQTKQHTFLISIQTRHASKGRIIKRQGVGGSW
jgi:hypothetical protein